MENASKALTIAASTLLGVMILVVIVYFFNNISSWPKQQDEMTKSEQIALFNKEYEVYNKKQMYGVDVISCLNKAKSNDEKYVEGGGFLTGDTYGTEYLIDVCVVLKTKLRESVEIYYLDNNGKQKQYLGNINDSKLSEYKYGVNVFKNMPIAELKSSGMTTLKVNDSLQAIDKEISGLTAGEEYCLLNISKTALDTSSKLLKILKFSNNIRPIESNTDGNYKQEGGGWSQVIWNTALYDFKKKNFKCTEIKYNENTGRIISLRFEEI